MAATINAQAFVYEPSDVAVDVRNGDAHIRIGGLSVYPMGAPGEQAVILDAIAALCNSARKALAPEPNEPGGPPDQMRDAGRGAQVA